MRESGQCVSLEKGYFLTLFSFTEVLTFARISVPVEKLTLLGMQTGKQAITIDHERGDLLEIKGNPERAY